MAERTQRSNILLAFISLTAVIAVVSLIGFFTLGKGPEIIQGQAEADEYRVSGKVPARILELRVKEGDKVKAGDTLVILEAPDVMAKLSQAQAAEQAARAISEKAQRGTRREQLQAAFEMWQKAKAGVEIAEKSYNRVNRLFEQGVMSAQKRDEAKAQFDAMAATEKLPVHSTKWLRMAPSRKTKQLPPHKWNVPKEQLPRCLPTWMRPSSQLLPTVK